MKLIRLALLILLALVLFFALSARAQSWSWSWTAPEPPLPNTQWFDYGWDSTSNGPMPAENAQRLARINDLMLMGFAANSAPVAAPQADPSSGASGERRKLTASSARDHSRNPFQAGEFSVSPFVGVNISTFEPLRGRGFAGLGVGYQLTRTIAVTAEAAATDIDERAIDQYGAHGKAYLPIGRSGLAAYGELGYQRFTVEDCNFMSTGAGLELRTKRLGAFIGGRWLQNFRDIGHAQFLLGGSFRF